MDRLRETERRLREIELGIGSEGHLLTSFFQQVAADDEVLLDALDLAISFERLDGGGDVTEQLIGLEAALEQAGSAWQVANYPAHYSCLERRVDATVTAVAREVMSTAGRAGQHLAVAWTRVYGRTPSPSEGYREAVRAVEAAAIPVVIPEDPGGTLGKVIAALRDAPGKWRVALAPSDGSNPVETVRHMCELLWKSQWDRHGVPDESVPLNVSLEEAQAAVHLAATLVQWFKSGAVTLAQQ